MLDQLVLWERPLFLWLNSPHTPYMDALCFLFSARWPWTAIAVMLLGWLFYKKSPWEALLFIVAVVLMITFTDQLTSHLIKPLCARLRPTYHPYTAELVRTTYRHLGWGYGFVSGHAANFMAIAMFSSLVFRNRLYTVVIFATALFVVYSRIYLGMHFVSDVIPGSLIGLLDGTLFYLLYRWSRSRLLPRSPYQRPEQLFAPTMALWNGMVIAFVVIMCGIALELSRLLIHLEQLPS